MNGVRLWEVSVYERCSFILYIYYLIISFAYPLTHRKGNRNNVKPKTQPGTHPVNFPSRKKPEHPEKTWRDFRQSVDWVFSRLLTWVDYERLEPIDWYTTGLLIRRQKWSHRKSRIWHTKMTTTIFCYFKLCICNRMGPSKISV